MLYQSVNKGGQNLCELPILQVKMSTTGNGSSANEDDVVDGSEGSDGLMGEVHEARGLPGN